MTSFELNQQPASQMATMLGAVLYSRPPFPDAPVNVGDYDLVVYLGLGDEHAPDSPVPEQDVRVKVLLVNSSTRQAAFKTIRFNKWPLLKYNWQVMPFVFKYLLEEHSVQKALFENLVQRVTALEQVSQVTPSVSKEHGTLPLIDPPENIRKSHAPPVVAPHPMHPDVQNQVEHPEARPDIMAGLGAEVPQEVVQSEFRQQGHPDAQPTVSRAARGPQQPPQRPARPGRYAQQSQQRPPRGPQAPPTSAQQMQQVVQQQMAPQVPAQQVQPVQGQQPTVLPTGRVPNAPALTPAEKAALRAGPTASDVDPAPPSDASYYMGYPEESISIWDES